MPESFSPVNRCIYCGTTDGPLSREHIVPLALNGDLILPKASCEECARKTSADELTVLRKSMREARAVLGYRSRKPREAPVDIEMEFIKGGKREVRRVPLTNAISPVPMPILELPGCLRSEDHDGRPSSSSVQVIAVGKDPQNVLLDNAADNIAMMAFVDIGAFSRMLGKIAYSYAVAKLGHERVRDSLLIPSLLHEKDEIGLWVGGTQQLVGKPDPVAYQIGFRVYNAPAKEGSVEVVLVLLRLFAHLGTPGYMVVLSRGRPLPIPDLKFDLE
jgi:hypothetical protein